MDDVLFVAGGATAFIAIIVGGIGVFRGDGAFSRLSVLALLLSGVLLLIATQVGS